MAERRFLTVFTSNATHAVLDNLAIAYERESAHSVTVQSACASVMLKPAKTGRSLRCCWGMKGLRTGVSSGHSLIGCCGPTGARGGLAELFWTFCDRA